MKLRKIIALTLVFIMAMSTASFAATMYAPDGRTINVYDWEVSAYQNVGWYTSPVVTVYAPDGRSCVIYEYELYSWESVGWIDGRKTSTIYAPDGRTATVPTWQVQSYLNVGWYSSPVYSQSTSQSCYPGTQVPTFNSISGGIHWDTYNDFIDTIYYYECSSVNQFYNYLEHLKSIGWVYHHNYYGGNSYLEYYTKPGSGITCVAVGFYVDDYDNSLNVGVGIRW